MNAQLDDAGLILFRKSALALVLCQLRFPVLPRFPESEFIDRFYRAIQHEYPKASRTNQIAFPVLSEQIPGQVPSSILWKFSSLNEDWAVVLTENAVTLESRAYGSFVEFLGRFSEIAKAAQSTLQPALQTRLGLRYINEFRVPEASTLLEWRRYIRPEVLGLTGVVHDLFEGGNVAFSRQEFEVTLPDGALVIRHGLHFGTTVEPPDLTSDPRAPVVQGPFYLLDMDRSDSTPQQLNLDLAERRLETFNKEVYRFFRWAIQRDLYEALEPSDGN